MVVRSNGGYLDGAYYLYCILHILTHMLLVANLINTKLIKRTTEK